ncbi:HEAT repeat domain-containing protein [Kitasatospora sp. NPDC056783]|uniref:HEAT repeat domain-containing protein n=1 Tax=Kitasatospora sp. NPDC056783 TaxID=3345943 RepID=UPI00369DD89C
MNRSDDLLFGLDDIDWAALGHAYGNAADVPGPLRAVCGADEKAREDAFRSLSGNIFHQGTRYSSSPFAVPFIARIAVDGPPSARVDALWLLTRLAVDWHDAYDLPLGIDTAAWRAAAVPHEESLRWYEEQLAAETDERRREGLSEMRDYAAAGHPIDSREGALRSYDAVRAELPRLRPLLDDPDPKVRTRSAYLLAWFPEEAAESLPPLVRRVAVERDLKAAATVLLSVGLLGNRRQAELLVPGLDAEDPLIRWAAATALARLFLLPGEPRLVDGRLLERVLAELVAASAAPVPEPGTDHDSDDLHRYTSRTLFALRGLAPDDDRLLTGVAHCLRFMDILALNDLAPSLLCTEFEPVGDGAGAVAFEDLAPALQGALRAVAERIPGDWYDNWLTGSKLRDALVALGLPDTAPALRTYAGLPTEEPARGDLYRRPGRQKGGGD